MVKVRFTASGYGTSTTHYKTHQEAVQAVEVEATDMAFDRDLDPQKAVFRASDEWTLSSRSGEEIARWEFV